ncbi:MAG TPA: hypothetical protein VFX88_15600 [Actinomycetota bacterium]|nr:hypothetical protein [Actinomycetota bacterium]
MGAELVAQGFTRTDRKCLVWVDAAVGICGLGGHHHLPEQLPRLRHLRHRRQPQMTVTVRPRVTARGPRR